jgi:hypothetical protein
VIGRLGLVMTLLLVGCRFAPDLPEGIACATNGDCPAGLICSADICCPPGGCGRARGEGEEAGVSARPIVDAAAAPDGPAPADASSPDVATARPADAFSADAPDAGGAGGIDARDAPAADGESRSLDTQASEVAPLPAADAAADAPTDGAPCRPNECGGRVGEVCVDMTLYECATGRNGCPEVRSTKLLSPRCGGP